MAKEAAFSGYRGAVWMGCAMDAGQPLVLMLFGCEFIAILIKLK
jgi:hypothetical protein